MISLSVIDTLLSVLPLVAAVFLYQWYLGRSGELIIAGARMVVQLVTVGYLLTLLFENNLSAVGIAVIVFMTLVSAWIAIRPLKERSWRIFSHALISLGISSALHLVWILFVVLRLDPWYQPQFVIPLAGMVLANGMNSLSIGAERLEAEMQNPGGRKASHIAFNAAMIPQVNALLAVGLVSLPGMMTGQILSGVSPLDAVRYQILVMSMVAGNSALALVLYFGLVKRSGQSGRVPN